MAWIRLDVRFFQHRKVLAAGRDGTDLYLAALCYCGSELNDGLIPGDALPLLATTARIKSGAASAAKLVEVGLWERDGADYRIHDYLDHQTSREQSLTTRAVRAEAGGRGGRQKAARMNGPSVANTKQTASNLLEGCQDFANDGSSKMLANGKQTPSKNVAEEEAEEEVEEERRAPPPTPVPRRVPDAPDVPDAPASREGGGGGGGGGGFDFRSLIGAETWAAILADIARIDPNLGPVWLQGQLATHAAGLPRPDLLSGLNTWHGRMRAKAKANEGAQPEYRIRVWESVAGKALATALQEVRHDD